jgi:replicative DNA helicase
MITRELPHSDEAETNLLSSCLIDGPQVVGRCIMAGIRPDSFYDTKHETVFGVMMDLYAANRLMDVIVLREEMDARGLLESVGGLPFLLGISKSIPTLTHSAEFIARVKELATIRATIRACVASVEELYGFNGNMDELMSAVGDRVTRAIGQGNSDAEETFQSVAGKLLIEVTTPVSEQVAPVGEVPWGNLIDINRGCGKMPAGNLIVVAGMPSTGKSALADQVAWATAESGKETLIFSYEMTKRDKCIRMAQQVSGINFDDVGRVPMDVRLRFVEALRKIKSCPTMHVFERDISVNRIVSRARAFAQRGRKVGFIVVDFLQYLARLEPSVGKERTDEKIGRITGALKNLGKDLECPVMLLSSLNRDGYREGNRPNLASLRSSGEIESDADVVGILHWPAEDPTGRSQDPHDDSQSTFYVEFNQDKGRSKGVQRAGLLFNRRSTKFENYICR